jgi:hypothetical protein
MFRWSYPLAVLLVVGAVGCGGKKALPGEGCTLNSDCNPGLSCTDKRCHVQCNEAIDCLPGQLCAGPPGAGLCLLPDEQECGLNSDCGPLFCAIDNTCRTQCENEHDCPTSTQTCVPSVNDVNIKVCAEPPELEDGILKPAPPPDGGTSPDAGADASDDSGPDAGADGAAESVPQGGDAGQPGDAGGTAEEKEPNEDWDHATPYTPGTTVSGSVGSAEDVDFYETVVPAGDLAGGYYQASITDVGEGRVSATVYTASDNRMIHQAPGPSNGASLFFYWAAARDQKYRIEVRRGGTFAAAYKYTFKIQYTRVDDAFEPNDSSAGDAPKLITLGTPITAYFFTGFKEMTINADDYQDWFVIDLPAGMTTVAITNRTTNWRPLFDLIDSLGNPLSMAREMGAAAGASINHPFMVTAPGRYRASIKGYGTQAIDEADNAMMVPDNFRESYTLTISQ